MGQAFRTARILHIAFVAWTLMIALAAYRAVHPTHVLEDSILVNAFAVMAFLAAGSASYLKRQAGLMVGAAALDVAKTQRWMVMTVISFSLGETVSLFGFALHAIGISDRISATFFVIGFAVLVGLRPASPDTLQPPSD